MPCTEHDHQIPTFTPTSNEDNLKDFIDLDNVQVLNCKYIPRSNTFNDFINNAIDTYENGTVLESDCDNQILLVIPFYGPVTLYSVLMDTSGSEGQPKHLDIYKDLDSSFNNFNSILSRKPDQSIEVLVGCNGINEYPLDRTKIFKNVSKVHMLLPDNWEDDEDLITKISYLEIRGFSKDSVTKARNQTEPTRVFFKPAQYEALGNPKDHKKNENTAFQMLNI